MRYLTYLFALAILFGSCAATKENTKINPLEKEILGTWFWGIYDGEKQALRYHKSAKFVADKSGIQFLNDGKIVKCQNSSPCGTPPIAYEEQAGT